MTPLRPKCRHRSPTSKPTRSIQTVHATFPHNALILVVTARLKAFIPQMQASQQDHEAMMAQHLVQLDALVAKRLEKFRGRIRGRQEERRVEVEKETREGQRRRRLLDFRGDFVRAKACTVHESSELDGPRMEDYNSLNSRIDKPEEELDEVNYGADATKEMKPELLPQRDDIYELYSPKRDEKIMTKITAKFERFKAARLERFQAEMQLAKKKARNPNESSSPIVEMVSTLARVLAKLMAGFIFRCVGGQSAGIRGRRRRCPG